MPGITPEIANLLQAEVTTLVNDISSFLFNEPVEEEMVTEHINKLSSICRLLELDSAVGLIGEFKKALNSIVDKGNTPSTFQPELTAILDIFPRFFSVFHQLDIRSPFLFMPELATLRRIQGLPPLYEFQLINQHPWPPSSRFQGVTALGEEARSALKKLKQIYQMGLLEILRGSDQKKGAAMLAKVADKLKVIFSSEAEAKYWALVALVAYGFHEQLLGFNPVRLRLLAAVERQLKTLLDGEANAAKAYPLGLWRAYGILLSLIPNKSAAAEDLCSWVGAPAFDFTDEGMNEARAMIFGGEGIDCEPLIDELNTGLNKLHNILEVVDSQGELSEEEGEDFGSVVQQLADLCRRNGLVKAADRFDGHYRAISEGGGDCWQPDSQLLRDTAHSILYLECLILYIREQTVAVQAFIQRLDLRSVDEIVERKLVDTSVSAVWSECLRKLAAAKDILDEVANDLVGDEVTESLLSTLDGIKGAATIVGDTHVANIVSRCRFFVSDRLFAASDKTCSLASFADTIVALEYYFQNTSKGIKSDYVLDIADDYMAAVEAA